MHPDHVGGLIDADDQPVFPKARVLVPSGELDYWGGDIPEGAPEVLTKQFQAAHRVIAAVGSRMQRLEGTDVLPGITRVPLPGHTPDHSGYRIVSGEDRILVWTDIVHLPGIQFPRPRPRSPSTSTHPRPPPPAATSWPNWPNPGNWSQGTIWIFRGSGMWRRTGMGFGFAACLEAFGLK